MICNSTQHASARAAGFTLIELLAVIVIISMVAGVATMGLAATGESARFRAAAAQWRDLDAKARLFSRSLGPVEMSLDDDGDEIRLQRLSSGEHLSAVSLPPGTVGRVQAKGDPPSIVFDRLGRTIDYDAVLRTGDRVMGWRVCGLTGLTLEAKP